MSLHILPDIEQGSPEWFDQRRGIVTASVVGKLITPKTLKPASNDISRSLTALLTAERITGWTDPTHTNDDMWRGIYEEPRAREKYAEHYGPVATVGFMIEDRWGFKIGYSPDGLVGDEGLLEIKAPRAKYHIATVIAGAVPPEHMPQLQCGLLVSGRKWVDYVPWVGGLPLWRKRVSPDPRWQEAIVEAVAKFEENAAELIAIYKAETEGLPATERAVDEEIVI